MDASSGRESIPLEPNLQQAFYQSVVLNKALSLACLQSGGKYTPSPAVDEDPLLNQEDVFLSFLNKVAQACDNQRGGTTVTACTVIQRPDGPEFLLCSNKRKEHERLEAKDFLEGLLRVVGGSSEQPSKKALVKQVLWRILMFNLPRVGAYLSILTSCLDACIADMDRGWPDQLIPERESVKETLQALKDKTIFPRDVMTSEATRNNFLSSCESLIKAIQASRANDTFQKAMIKKASDGQMNSSETWCELRHFLGRVLSYRYAAEAIVSASERWPALFRDPKVTWIASSRPAPNPVSSSSSSSRSRSSRNAALPTAASIVRLVEPRETAEQYVPLTVDMQKFGLDALVAQQAGKARFHPYVHAEVLLHDHLVRGGGGNVGGGSSGSEPRHPRRRGAEHWNGWRCIGASKPTCRLCRHHFDAAHHGAGAGEEDRVVLVRPGHGNLYTNWRAPDVYRDQGPEAAAARRDTLLRAVQEAVWRDVRRLLHERLARGRNHDSETYSGLPSSLRLGDDEGERGEVVPASSSSPSLLPSSEAETEGEEASDDEGALPGACRSSVASNISSSSSPTTPIESDNSGRRCETGPDSEDEDGGAVL